MVEPELPPEIVALINTLREVLDQEKTVAFWLMGNQIRKIVRKNKKHSDFVENLVPILSQSLKISRTNIYLSLQFVEKYPKKIHARGQIKWTHYRELLTIPDKETRQLYEERIRNESLTSRDLAVCLRQDRGLPAPKTPSSTLRVVRGKPFLYQIKTILNQPQIDLGFHIFADPPRADEPTAICATPDISESHYTYKAFLLDVVDGDTLTLYIPLGLGQSTIQKLRLRGIDAPELGTREGQAAKDYLETRLTNCPFMVVKTYWRDKFARYLVDVFYDSQEPDVYRLANNGTFLNQELIDKGYAVAY